MILGMGPMELGIILLVVLVIFGPKNLPKLGSALGKTVRNVREGMEGEDAGPAPAEPEVAQATADKNEANMNEDPE